MALTFTFRSITSVLSITYKVPNDILICVVGKGFWHHDSFEETYHVIILGLTVDLGISRIVIAWSPLKCMDI